jgi:hypothetical protein
MFKNKKKIVSLMLLGLILLSSPLQSLASGILVEYYPPSDSDFFQKRITKQYYNSFGVTKLVITQYEYPGQTNVIGTKEFTVTENSNIWIDFTCQGYAVVEWKDSTGAVKDWYVRGEAELWLSQGDCSNFANLSNYNEELGQYADDTFGATKEAPGTPPQDGSGGGTTDPGTGGDGGTTDPTAPPPYWDEYTDQIDQIIAKIPPPPNWQEVAETFRDTIAPRIKDDMGDLLGSAPEPPAAPSAPATPSDMDNLDDGGFKSKKPTGTEAEGLEEAGFSSDDIKNGAPQIQERPDPNTDGFKINDPLDGLPSQEEFMENLPTMPEDAEVPAAPEEKDNTAPTPEEKDNAAPTPEEKDNAAPEPEDEGATAPIPSDDGAIAPTPSDPGAEAPIPSDGATAPIPGDSGGEAPIPSPGNETAPLPGQP